MFFVIVEELRICALYWKNNVGDGDAKLDAKEMFKQCLTFAKLHWVRILFFAYLFTFASCIIILAVPLEGSPFDTTNATATHRMLRGGGGVIAASGSQTTGSIGAYKEMVYAGDSQEVQGLLWFCLFWANMFMMPFVGFKLFTPFESLNIFMLSVVKM